MKRNFMIKYLTVIIIKILLIVALNIAVTIYLGYTYLTLMLIILKIYYIISTSYIYNNFKKYLNRFEDGQYYTIKLKSGLKVKFIDELYLRGLKEFPIAIDQTAISLTNNFGGNYFIKVKDFSLDENKKDVVTVKKTKWDNAIMSDQLVFYYSDGLVKKQEEMFVPTKFIFNHNSENISMSFIEVGEDDDKL